MMMTSRQQAKRTRKTFITRTALVSVFVLLLVLFNVFDFNPLSRVAHFAAPPLLSGEQAFTDNVGTLALLFRSKRTLDEENQMLEERLREMEHLAVSNKALEAENKELLFLLGREREEQSILATVLSRPNVSPYDTAIIDVGSRNNIHVGDRVVALGDFLVGFISRVYPNSAQVTFYSSPGQKTNIFIGEEAGIATAEGRGGNNFLATLPRDIEVSEGDTVTLTDAPQQVFGVVEAVNRSSTDAFQTILFKNPVNIFTIQRVEVILSETSGL